ncbi:MAG: o-succinylbenzoate synthase [Coriobacteriia bacterium]|nr:o-succinylbenzoate synthase [Coriobacteriia bacterium]MBS5477876.1 o-succinylbenzoate synthase [Coriobacteriia bacterium]
MSGETGNEFACAFACTLARRPNAPFLWLCDGERGASDGVSLPTVSYAEMDDAARRVASGLAVRGVRAGDYVPVDLANSSAFVAFMLAASRVGCALVTLNARLSSAEKRLRLEGLRGTLGAELPDPLSETDVEGMMGARARVETDVLGTDVTSGSATAVVMFTSGTTGAPKAVPLTWDNLCGSARASNERLSRPGAGLWQATLPMYHVGGLQVLVRSVLNGTPLALYRRFDAARVLSDAAELGATHLSVVDATLQDLLDADDRRSSEGLARVLPRYDCLLLGGSAPNPATLRRAVEAGARVWASFGMTETSSQVANAPVTEAFDGWLELLPGYEARAVGGQLALGGPGVMGGYLNAPTPRAADGLLLSGDTGVVRGNRIRVGERTADMFVSGGENVYPAEVEDALRRVPGVRDAYVFGARDERWGRRPVAFVEMPAGADAGPAVARAAAVREGLAKTLSKINLPDRLYVLDEFPRTGIGKVDRSALRAHDDARICVRRIDIWRIEQPFVQPITTARTTLRTRPSLIVRVRGERGNAGLGECVSFTTPWYLPETLGEDLRALSEHLVPLVLGTPLLDPWQAEELLASCPEARRLPMARAALENALWDLWARQRGLPLWRVLLEEAGESACAGTTEGLTVPAGAVLGIGSIDETRAAADRAVAAGYARIKMKVRPGDDVACVRAVRVDHPDLMVTLDANGSYTEADAALLRELDELGARCIEEPLDPARPPAEGPAGLWERLERLQATMHTLICLDESVTCAEDAWHVLESHPALRCFALKIGKFGGVAPALRFYREARKRGAEVWMGGMFDTSISKRLHAAFEALPGVDIPGDLCSTARYFARDVAKPELVVDGGRISLDSPGLGCDLDEGAVACLCTEHLAFEV